MKIKIKINLLVFTLPLTLLLVALKLFGVVDWSWWAVTAPTWLSILIPLAISLCVVLFTGAVFVLMFMLGKRPTKTVDADGTIRYTYKSEES